jgi:integrase
VGRVYQQTGSTKLYLDYVDHRGRRVRVSARTTDPKVARRKLRDLEGRIARGEPVAAHADAVRYEHLRADVLLHWQTTGSRDVDDATKRLRHLDTFFRGTRAIAIDRPMITQYAKQRQDQGAANGTINREIGILGRMLNLGEENGRLYRAPRLRGLKLAEAPARQGFFEREQFEAVANRLKPDLRAAVAVSYAFGWRMQSETLMLERRHLDLAAQTLRLDTSKNGEGRVVALPDDLAAMLAEQVARIETVQRESGRIIPWLFPHLTGTKRLGARRRDFAKAWRVACEAAGVAGRLRHDLRRTAARDMERQGVPRGVAMKIIGHKTEAMYRRYAIVNEADIREAARRRTGILQGIVGETRIATSRESKRNPKSARAL